MSGFVMPPKTKTAELERALETLSRLPLFQMVPVERLKIEPSTGLTNINFKVWDGSNAYALRLPGSGTEAFIDRKAESHNARLAARLGIGVKILHFDPEDGAMVTPWLRKARPLAPEDLRRRPNLERAAGLLRVLHASGHDFMGRFDVFEKLSDYRTLLRKAKVRMPKGFAKVENVLSRIRDFLYKQPFRPVPCHCDTVPENFVLSADKLLLLDWEYSGMGDPIWDLADLSAEAELEPEQEEALLSAYHGGSFPLAALARLRVMKPLCHLLWTVWGLFQSVNTGDCSLRDYGLRRYESFLGLIGGRDYKKRIMGTGH